MAQSLALYDIKYFTDCREEKKLGGSWTDLGASGTLKTRTIMACFHSVGSFDVVTDRVIRYDNELAKSGAHPLENNC